MTLVFKLLPHSNLTSVETLTIMTVDWLRGGRSGGGEREWDMEEENIERGRERREGKD